MKCFIQLGCIQEKEHEIYTNRKQNTGDVVLKSNKTLWNCGNK